MLTNNGKKTFVVASKKSSALSSYHRKSKSLDGNQLPMAHQDGTNVFIHSLATLQLRDLIKQFTRNKIGNIIGPIKA